MQLGLIPGPPGLPLIGNLLDIDLENTFQSFVALGEKYGTIYKLRLGGNDRIFLGGHEFVREVCSRKEFVKHIAGATAILNKVIPDGLFTSLHGNSNWGLARRTLNPAFAPKHVRAMFPDMLDITSQLVLKWARFGPSSELDLQQDFTRLTLDTIALTGMDSRFNSFYHDDFHPFAQRFGAMFAECQRRSNRPAWYTSLMWGANKQFDENNAWIRDFCADVLARHRASPSDKDDLLSAMLYRKDPVTGLQLSDSIIIDNMITFLFAGHDTTAGLLSFLLYHLIKNPAAYARVQAEVDDTLGTGGVVPRHLNQLPFTKACIREALRLDPPAQAFILTPLIDDGAPPVVVGNRYPIHYGQGVVVLPAALHRDPTVWGEDALDFKPERMSEENFKQLPKYAFMPFGHGPRNCIGQDFAMQEAMVAIAMLFQNFNFKLADPDYELQYQPSLNRRAKNLFIHANLRPGISLLSLQRDLFTPAPYPQ